MKTVKANALDFTAATDFIAANPSLSMGLAALGLMAFCWITKDFI